jgi:RNA polymerase sigma factor (sigma-70 family)
MHKYDAEDIRIMFYRYERGDMQSRDMLLCLIDRIAMSHARNKFPYSMEDVADLRGKYGRILETCDDPNKLAAYVRNAVNYHIANHNRSKYNRGLREKAWDSVTESHEAPDAELVAQLHEAIESLPYQYKRLIERHYFQGIHLNECGRMNNVSPATMSCRHKQALAALKAKMADSLND